MSTRLIISISSDIGLALARRWRSQGHRIFGTYRTRSDGLAALEAEGAQAVHCDMGDTGSVARASDDLLRQCGAWDAVVFGTGATDPIGPFAETDFDAWARSIELNFTSQLRMLHSLLPRRNRENALGPLVLFFAGGGVNSAPVNYSAYTLSKIALTKACELLDAEVADTRFAILGPGWVRTKIHASTLAAQDRAGPNYERTRRKLAGDECAPMQAVLDCCDWMIATPRDVIGGRNISLVHDEWGKPSLDEMLREEPDMYKLRRAGNDRLVRREPVTEAGIAGTDA